MLLEPRPMMPYWPAYPEPERSRLETEYRKAEAEWARRTVHMLVLNMTMAMIGPVAFAVAVSSAVWLLKAAI